MVNLAVLAEDAKEALKYGVDGILVSNHGARQLDGVSATVSVRWRNEAWLFSKDSGLWFTEVDAKQRFGCNLKFYECIVVSKTEEHGLSMKSVLNIDTEMVYVLCYDL